MTNVSKHRWNVHELRKRQQYSLSFIFNNKASGGTALLVDRTGGGKSHTMRCSGVFTRGIIVIIVPLLALAADVFLKFITDDDSYGPIQAVHFDEDIGCADSFHYVRAVGIAKSSAFALWDTYPTEL